MTVPFEDHGTPRGCVGILAAVVVCASLLLTIALLAVHLFA